MSRTVWASGGGYSSASLSDAGRGRFILSAREHREQAGVWLSADELRSLGAAIQRVLANDHEEES